MRAPQNGNRGPVAGEQGNRWIWAIRRRTSRRTSTVHVEATLARSITGNEFTDILECRTVHGQGYFQYEVAAGNARVSEGVVLGP